MHMGPMITGSWWLLALAIGQTGPLTPATPQDPAVPREHGRSVLKNGDFNDWTGGVPDGWDLAIGASNGGPRPLSMVRQGEGPSLELSGDGQTLAWQMVSQTIPVMPGEVWRIRYMVRTRGLQREGNQYDNCFVGLFQKSAEGRVIERSSWRNDVTQYTEVSVTTRIRSPASEAQLLIFLSQTGTMNVKNIRLEKVEPEESFDLMVSDMRRRYSFFDQRQVDWGDLVRRHQAAGRAAETPRQFIEVARAMLGELEDMHVWIEFDGDRIRTHTSRMPGNHDFPLIDGELVDRRQIGRLAVVGRTAEGFGYVRVTSLSRIAPQAAAELTAEIEKLFDAPGLIVDIRSNGGGNERVARGIASLFTDETLPYARQKFRTGSEANEFYETAPRTLEPRQGGDSYAGPVVCLIGPGAISSGEGMALMMAALPRCTLIGLPTRGSSGNPRPVALPNGVDVWYSRWVPMTPAGQPIEGVGVQPDIRVEHAAGDPAWERALEFLREP